MPRHRSQAFPVVGAIIEKDGKFLLVQELGKGTAKIDAGKWNQPAGWPDVGEPPLDAAKREVKEETGFDFEPTGLVGIYSLYRKDLEGKFPDGTPHPYKLIFRGNITGKEQVDPSEIRALKWFTPDEIFAMDTETLRDLDIKQEIRDYLAGRSYPLEILRHTVS